VRKHKGFLLLAQPAKPYEKKDRSGRRCGLPKQWSVNCWLDSSNHLFDPSVGAGAFFQASKKLSGNKRLLGYEVDRQALQQARDNNLSADDLAHVQLKDFALRPPNPDEPEPNR
jgi:23S rRNA G2445 N2-methylase RlmL